LYLPAEQVICSCSWKRC